MVLYDSYTIEAQDHVNSEEPVVVCAVPPGPETPQRNFKKNFEYKPIPIFSAANFTDRFIPRRCGYNSEISRLNLMGRNSPNHLDDERYLSVLHQVNTLHHSWRKRRMIKVMNELGVVRGIDNYKVLNFTSKSSCAERAKVPIYHSNREKIIDDTSLADIWKVRPRNKPLMGNFAETLKLHGYRRFPSRGVIDWGATDVIVAAVEEKIYFFNNNHHNSPTVLDIEFPTIAVRRIRCVKWDHNGHNIALCSRNLDLVVYNVEAEKMMWRDYCPCEECIIRCICWTNNDSEIITGCSAGHLSVFRVSGESLEHSDRMIDTIHAHDGNILSMGISPNNRYLVSTGMDKSVRVYLYPELAIYLEIGYYDAVDTHAWHPWSAGILCIGGGLGDGSLSLWDIERQQCIGYRRVDFLSYVKHLAWNKTSGELVVVWYYWEDDTRRVTIPVLANWDRIVDVVNFKQDEPCTSIANVIWNPKHTIIGIQTEENIHCMNMFGNYANAWEKQSQKREKRSAGQRSKFDLFCIR